jgi:hypothetical protein
MPLVATLPKGEGLIRKLFIASLAAMLLVEPPAFAADSDRPPVNQPVKGTESPDVRSTEPQKMKDAKEPDVRLHGDLDAASGITGTKVRQNAVYREERRPGIDYRFPRPSGLILSPGLRHPSGRIRGILLPVKGGQTFRT